MTLQGLIKKNQWNEAELAELKELAAACEQYENIRLKLHWTMLGQRQPEETNDFLWYEDGRLVGFAGLYSFNPAEAEVSGVVHPSFRRRGIFRTLNEAVVQEAHSRSVPRLLYICADTSASGKACVAALGAAYSFSEFGMRRNTLENGHSLEAEQAGEQPESAKALRLARATAVDRELLIDLDSRGFAMSVEDAQQFIDMVLANSDEHIYIAYAGGKPVGKLCALNRDGNTHLYGFAVVPEHRGRGIGRSILRESIRLVSAPDIATITLEVACDNRRALGLYLSCGFEETNVIDYYERKLND